MGGAFTGRVVIVTGAGGGLGRAYARELASHGASVVVNDIGVGPDGSARTVVEEIVAAGGTAVADTHSVADPEGAQGIARTALEAFGRIDGLINNAGILRKASFAKTDPATFRETLEVHLHGSFLVARAVWPHLRERGYGRILNTTSSAGLLGAVGSTSYACAKTGIVGLTRIMAIEGERSGIKVNALAPIALTRMTEDLPLEGWTPERLDPAKVAPAAAWLVHEDCEVTGEIYTAGGGRVARFFIGMTEGHYQDGLTLQDVLDNVERIRDRTGYHLPLSPTDEFAHLQKHFAAAVGSG